MADEERAESWRSFDLAHQNLQSISKAQHFYLSTLLAYLSVVWGWYFVAAKEALSIQIFGITLKTGGLWVVTPGVTTALSLALIGAVNAAGPAWGRLREQAGHIGVGWLTCAVTFYQLDTHKNLFDYLTYLRLHPEKPPSEEPRRRFYVWHFLYPSLYAWSIYTSFRAVIEVWGFRGLFHHRAALLYGTTCLALQTVYSVRPWWRAICRFLGVRTHAVYD
ncbi:MAG: hypothetical protein WAQ52_06590 [Terriglobales bacterium]